MGRTIDIRDEDKENVTTIIVSGRVKLISTLGGFIVKPAEGRDSSLVKNKEEANNLQKAIQKAKDLGWV